MGRIVIIYLLLALLQSGVRCNECKDDEKIDCVMLASMFNICNVNIENAAKLCRQTCNLCYYPNGNWAEWSSWSACLVTCGNASQTRTRPCTNPPPESHGKDCEGSNEDFKQCVLGPCPVDGNWTDWSTWSACAITCGNITQTRTRTCTNPPPSHNGTDCQGTSEDYQPCVREHCPVDGNWTDWSSWSACSVTCGSATQSRIRTCTNPPPANNGTECEDSSEDYKSCVHEPCRGWGQWSEWGSCSSTCGVGMQHRNRSCYTPIYTSIDDLCIGDYTDVQICMSRACADGGWSTWSPWSTCSASCFGGNRQRYRSCTNPPPSPFGQPCVGQSVDVDSCNTYDCTVGGWSDWGSWSTCTASCLGGNNQRRRECTNPSPSPFGRPCEGPNVETGICNVHGCEGMRLVSGRVEVFLNDQWGTVCDDNFASNSNGATVVCRILGLPTSNASFIGPIAGPGSMPIWLDDVICTGSETTLIECKHAGIGLHNCYHAEDAGMSCTEQ